MVADLMDDVHYCLSLSKHLVLPCHISRGVCKTVQPEVVTLHSTEVMMYFMHWAGKSTKLLVSKSHVLLLYSTSSERYVHAREEKIVHSAVQ